MRCRCQAAGRGCLQRALGRGARSRRRRARDAVRHRPPMRRGTAGVGVGEPGGRSPPPRRHRRAVSSVGGGGRETVRQRRGEWGWPKAVPVQGQWGWPEAVPVQGRWEWPEAVPVQGQWGWPEAVPVQGRWGWPEAVPVQGQWGWPKAVPVQGRWGWPEAVPVQGRRGGLGVPVQGHPRVVGWRTQGRVATVTWVMVPRRCRRWWEGEGQSPPRLTPGGRWELPARWTYRPGGPRRCARRPQPGRCATPTEVRWLHGGWRAEDPTGQELR